MDAISEKNFRMPSQRPLKEMTAAIALRVKLPGKLYSKACTHSCSCHQSYLAWSTDLAEKLEIQNIHLRKMLRFSPAIR